MKALHRGFRSIAIAIVTSVAMSAAAFAQHGGGYGGAYHGGYGGWRGGYGGWRGGYGGYRGWYGGWGGWGWGLGYGAFLATLPLYYSTWWWGGVPYYYAYNNYYVWNPAAGGYVTVTPPPQVVSQAGAPAAGTPASSGTQAPAAASLFAYPTKGQTNEQQATDRFECHRWAVSQTGFDPTLAGGIAPAKGQDYRRAQAACLEGRGYSVQ